MGNLSRFYNRMAHSTPERKVARALLKAAKQENHEAYLALVANYLDLAVTYFGSSRPEPVETRLARVEQVFLGLWQHLRYAERLSDFEYMLADALIENTDAHGPVASPEPLVTKLRLLPAHSRFVFLAHEFEHWSERWVTLIMRTRPSALHKELSQVRCELCGISWDSLAPEERECLTAISAAFNQCDNLRQNRAVCARTRQFPRVMEIKAHWLELRPELVEVRHRYLPAPDQRDRLLANILRGVARVPLRRPPLVDRMVNTVHFSRHAKIRVS